jgi:hypothetical protein
MDTWYCLSEETPQPNRVIELEVDEKTTRITKTLPHHGKVMIKIDGEKGFFRAKFTHEFDQSLRWRYTDTI